MFFNVNGVLKGPFIAHKGTPPGTILSPLLFNIYLRNLHKHIEIDSNILQYADDIAVFTSSTKLMDAVNTFKKSIDRVARFLKDKGLTLSPSKSQFMVFSRRRTTHENGSSNPPTINIGGEIIPRVDCALFLGILFDDKLKGHKHLQHLIIKGRKLANIISSLSNV